ncbi:hypothetical protein BFW38_01120 [Terasakiispira papahanaumokuakeensis]|uniref:Uncharacterized protein n=1 Tax=Terasakiispira papahanaumokuakeensis TaxID=197479 RepID=A0A1E2V5U1_9GAMM|nr:hypothetical protein BFW38_01120 [Terasakiispira papahanaumokuakeensis]
MLENKLGIALNGFIPAILGRATTAFGGNKAMVSGFDPMYLKRARKLIACDVIRPTKRIPCVPWVISSGCDAL